MGEDRGNRSPINLVANVQVHPFILKFYHKHTRNPAKAAHEWGFHRDRGRFRGLKRESGVRAPIALDSNNINFSFLGNLSTIFINIWVQCTFKCGENRNNGKLLISNVFWVGKCVIISQYFGKNHDR